MNRLYYGDCFSVIQDYFGNAAVDLIYLDPPFNSQRQYNSIYRDETGRPLPDQIEAFCDMWELNADREQEIRTMPVLMRESGIDDATVEFWRLWMNALRGTQPRLLAYLSYMARRLLVLHRILKPTGSLYFHCDPTVSHYVKPLLDAIFGHRNFRNEIIWQRTRSHSHAKRWGPVTDTLLYYGKSGRVTWNPPHIEHDDEYVSSKYRYNDDDGRGPYSLDNITSPALRPNLIYEWKGHESPTLGWRYSRDTMAKLDADGRIWYPDSKSKRPRLKRYLNEMSGPVMNSVWTDIDSINSQAKERMGYATQKPVALLERIIKASSNPGDVVLDPFCGCATTIEAAHRLGRKWIGIDIAIHAVKRVARVRLKERLGLVEGEDYEVEGVPQTLEGAQDLWERDKYQFQKWAVEQVDGFVTAKQSADGGIDGRLYFDVPNERDLQSMVLEVKGGASVGIGVLRQLKGVLDTTSALMAGLIVMRPLGTVQMRNFNRFMGEAGTLNVLGIDFPKMQILTVEDILAGRRFKTPTVAGLHIPQPRMPGVPV
ncbi:MAG: DNA methyltransferase [Chloroflexi bacterium]|nr:DNA methyltransferase [Chloroflexota bacterium]